MKRYGPVSSRADCQIESIYQELIGDHDPGSPSSDDIPLESQPQSSLPEPLYRAKVKQEVKQEVKAEPSLASGSRHVNQETDAEMAARLQREFDGEGSRGRASRSGGVTKKKTVKRKSKATVGSDEDGEPKKKRKGGGGGAFNKELILR